MSQSYSLYQVDAFADCVFTGNPAAVVPMETWPPDATLAAIAAENNLSETAFFIPLPDDSSGGSYHLRWFTPTFEIDLCGHATLAAAFVLFTELGHQGKRIHFHTQSGDIFVERSGNQLAMDFPVWPAKSITVSDAIAHALGARPQEAYISRDLFIVFPNEQTIRAMKPNPALLLTLPYVCIICAAPSATPGVDYVCRVFSPEIGIMEDPVTGSAQCTQAPYWADRLGKTSLVCDQVSARGGRLLCEYQGDRVRISGGAALYMRGTIYV